MTQPALGRTQISNSDHFNPFFTPKKGKCVLDAANADCDVELTCTAEKMDIKFGHNLFGSLTADAFDHYEESCRPAHIDINPKLKFHYDEELGQDLTTYKEGLRSERRGALGAVF